MEKDQIFPRTRFVNNQKRAVRFCRLRGNRLLFGCALTVTSHADSAQPLIGCLDMNIVCRRQCSDQSEARIPVTECYGILTGCGPDGVARCLACIHQSDAQFMPRGRNIPPEISLACSLLSQVFQLEFGCCKKQIWSTPLMD